MATNKVVWPRKFLLISDGVFQFPQLLAVITGTAALKGLTDSGHSAEKINARVD